ncbi:MAG TPA: hypothetical protein VMY37_20950, partial [Thermoguttaceae bacterium]|nr:hypothetical protein [Thermoguttaceae bacterium]
QSSQIRVTGQVVLPLSSTGRAGGASPVCLAHQTTIPRGWLSQVNTHNVESFRFTDPGQPAYYADVFLEGWSTSYRFPAGWKDREVFQIGPDGRLEDHDLFNIFLGTAVGKSRVVLKMEYPAAGTFAVLVREVHSRTNDPRPPELAVSLDGRDAVKEALAVGSGNTLDFYQRYEFPVPAGPHAIGIENSGGGLFTAGYELGGFVRRQGPDLQVRGLQTEDVILLWLKSPKLTWLYSRMGVVPEEQFSGKLVLAGAPDGVWIAEWLDTMQDEWIMRTVERTADGQLVLETPPIKRGVAVRLLKVDEARYPMRSAVSETETGMDREAPK